MVSADLPNHPDDFNPRKSKDPLAEQILDLTEGDKGLTDALQDCIAVLERSPYEELPEQSSAHRYMGALHYAVQTSTMKTPSPMIGGTVKKEPWKLELWAEILRVVRALLAEEDLKEGFSMLAWLRLRVETISGGYFIIPYVRRSLEMSMFPHLDSMTS